MFHCDLHVLTHNGGMLSSWPSTVLFQNKYMVIRGYAGESWQIHKDVRRNVRTLRVLSKNVRVFAELNSVCLAEGRTRVPVRQPCYTIAIIDPNPNLVSSSAKNKGKIKRGQAKTPKFCACGGLKDHYNSLIQYFCVKCSVFFLVFFR